MSKKIHTEDFPDSWELVPLGEFVENEKGKKPKQESKEKSPEFNLPYIDIQAFEEGIIKSWTNGESCRLCHEDDFLMVWDGSRSGLVGKGVNGALGSTLVRINFPGIFNDYAYYFLQSKFAEINSRAKGVGIPHVDPNLLWNYGFPIPPLNEQKRIVAKIEELFSELDSGIESLKTAREQLKVYRQAVLKHAFEGKLTAPWREKNKDKLESTDQLLARIKRDREEHYQQELNEYSIALKQCDKDRDAAKKPNKPNKPSAINKISDEKLAELAPLPLGWSWLQVSDLCDVVRGGSPRPAGDPQYYDGNIPFLKVADITRKAGAYLDSYTYTIKPAGLTKTRLISPKKLLLSNSGATLGVPKICLIEATFNDGIAAFLGLAEELLIYHYYFWLSKTDKLRAINQGAAQPNLNTDLIKEFFIPICSSEEMRLVAQEIESKLSVCDQLELEIEINLQKSEALRQSILKKAFCGQLVAQNPADEPASVLLERIRSEKQKSAAKPASKPKKRAA